MKGPEMTEPRWSHPDPYYQPEFYESVPLKRFIAWVVDTFITLLLVALAIPLTAFTGLFFIPFLILTIGFAYRVITLSAWSATLGMKLVSIELLNAEGRSFDFPTAFLHTLGYTMSWVVPIVQFMSVVFMASSERGQGLTDMALGTVAINRRKRS